MSLLPLRDYVLVEKEAVAESKTPSGLVLVPTAVEKLASGTVVAVGGGWHTSDGKLVSLGVSVGDKVMFSPGMATEVKHDDKNLLLLREEHLVAVVK